MNEPVSTTSQRRVLVLAIAVALVAAVVGWWLVIRPGVWPHRQNGSVRSRDTAPGGPRDPLKPAVTAYASGRYRDAEAAARRVIDSTRGSADPHKRKHAARARYILAFSAARRKDFPLARERFDNLREEASHLADKGKLDAGLGQPSYTLEEEGAYQRAICASAMGDKKTAEAELIQFMRDYPESPLIHGAVQRIRRG